jgi:uncharacterized membrane protein YkvA (DUF1232 family)
MSLRPLSTWPAIFRTLFSSVRLAIRLLREPQVGLLAKAVPVLGVAYVISPLDFVPDVLPIIGELDDLAIVLIVLQLFLRLCPTDAVSFHRSAIEDGRRYSPMPAPTSGDVIDAEWRTESR